MIDLAAIATALAGAYSPQEANKLFRSIGEDFEKTNDGESSHGDHMHDAIADLETRDRTLILVAAVLKDPTQVLNHELLALLEPVSRDVSRTLAKALAPAYPPTAADKLFEGIHENFQKTDDGKGNHEKHMRRAIADLKGGVRTLRLIAAVLDDPTHADNHELHATLGPITQDVRWSLLGTLGLMLTDGPFVNRTNLKSALEKLFMGRRVLTIAGSGGALGRSWSRKLITYQATQRRARYLEADLRKAPEEARSKPGWLAEKFRQELFPQSTSDAFFRALAETRLIEAFVRKWVPPPAPVVVVIDHWGDAGVALLVREFVTDFALAVAGGSLQGLRLVLIDGPRDIDLSEHDMHTIEDIVGSVSTDHFEGFFLEAAKALYPGLDVAKRQLKIETAMAQIAPLVATGMSRKVALAVRDSLEEMAMERKAG